MDKRAPVIVAAAVLIERGRVLLTQRKAGAHLGGAWEFPGGKGRAGRRPAPPSRASSSRRSASKPIGAPLEITFHAYPEKDVLLLFYEAHRSPGGPEPTAKDVAAWKWAGADDLDPSAFPPADVPILELVRELL
ncbi:MAG: NUDIX domain-containing protein [Polyangiaceae bacterium]